jgi:phage virion morphogenesis protein
MPKNDFSELEETLRALTQNLEAKNIARGTRKAAKVLRAANAKRIAKNISPEGAPFAPRKTPKTFKPTTAARFLYPAHGAGVARLVVLTSWTAKGKYIVGHDNEKGAERRFLREKIIRWLPDSKPKLGLKASPLKEKRSRRRKMFEAIKTMRHLKTKANSNGFEVGFLHARTSKIAAIHHFGKMAKITKDNPNLYKYPARELLGVNAQDETNILEIVAQTIGF